MNYCYHDEVPGLQSIPDEDIQLDDLFLKDEERKEVDLFVSSFLISQSHFADALMHEIIRTCPKKILIAGGYNSGPTILAKAIISTLQRGTNFEIQPYRLRCEEIITGNMTDTAFALKNIKRFLAKSRSILFIYRIEEMLMEHFGMETACYSDIMHIKDFIAKSLVKDMPDNVTVIATAACELKQFGDVSLRLAFDDCIELLPQCKGDIDRYLDKLLSNSFLEPEETMKAIEEQAVFDYSYESAKKLLNKEIRKAALKLLARNGGDPDYAC